ncbi:MAG: histone deacetylase [Planctomycetota bacterium]|nr:MAG: histone deacetylase [Planctomycetota bacterium]REK47629.1 MAG: histone deacetylase [Planctomycetota bacterium]
MTLLYHSPDFLAHDTGRHPERAERLVQVVRHLERTRLVERCHCPRWKPLGEAEMAGSHDADYLAELQAFVRRGGGRIEQDTVVSDASFDVAALAAGAVCDAVDRLLAGDTERTALCLARPPGHHALRDGAMGFCLLNHIALGARRATDQHELDRVLIVDWDVHHGNGTQDAFWEDGRVGFLSIHRWPFYPGSGADDETGGGAGQGTTLNLPIEFGTSRREYLDCFTTRLHDFADRIRPQLVLLSAGFDSHRDDPIGSLGLETEDFIPLTEAVLAVADQFAEGRLVSLLEGGYNPGVLAGCIEQHLTTLLDHDS